MSNFSPGLLLQRLSDFDSVESEIAPKKASISWSFDIKPTQSVKGVFMSRAKSYFDDSATPVDNDKGNDGSFPKM